jgi:hypothetical protein
VLLLLLLLLPESALHFQGHAASGHWHADAGHLGGNGTAGSSVLLATPIYSYGAASSPANGTVLGWPATDMAAVCSTSSLCYNEVSQARWCAYNAHHSFLATLVVFDHTLRQYSLQLEIVGQAAKP